MLSNFPHYLMPGVLKLRCASELRSELANKQLAPILRLSDSVSLR